MKISKLVRPVLTVLAIMLAGMLYIDTAIASTACIGGVVKIHTGSGGNAWVYLDNGGSGYRPPATPGEVDLSNKAILDIASTALTTNSEVEIDYKSDTANCTDVGRSDIVGITLFRTYHLVSE